MNLTDEYWSERYKQQQIGWDMGQVSPPLQAYINQITDKSLRILIPGCGNAHEADYLLQNNFENITLIDISEILVNKIKTVFSEYIENERLTILHQDIFEHQGTYDLILEQTLFCAINPTLRAAYAQKMYELLAPKGKLVGVLFDRDFPGGPPFGGSAEEYRTYFSPYFNFLTYERCHNSIPNRANTELFINLQRKG